MKKFITALLSTIACVCNMHAQEYMIVEQKDGIKKEFKIKDVARVYFETRQEPEPVLLTCPDSNHPHAIDLGLPSGTKWACCNVGASAPEKYGNYYAWGETAPKYAYDFDTYAHWNSKTKEYVDIGSDIAGTSYDVAYVDWGSAWCMPSLELIDELFEKCLIKKNERRNGIKGTLITGKNGGQIFLPATGFRHNFIIELEGNGGGSYWTSSLNLDKTNTAHCFSNGNHAAMERTFGLAVRAVYPSKNKEIE